MTHPFPAGKKRIDRLAIFGAGASGRELAWLAQECLGMDIPLTFVVDRSDLVGGTQNGIRIAHLKQFANDFPGSSVVVAVGNPSQREECAQKCADAGMTFASLVHPRAELSDFVTLGEGTIVCAGTILTTNIQVGKHVHLNVGCTISHDADIGDFATLSPGVHISGWVKVGRRAFFGTGAVVINGSSDRPVTIGEGAVVGAGACVIRDVQPRTTVVGVPATRTL